MNITEIAKRAKVSRSTVSRVLNNHPLVKDETRATVQKVIDEMNYIPNFAARSLVSKKNNLIGVLIYNIVQTFWAGIFSGIEQSIANTENGIFMVNSKSHLDLWDHRKNYKKNLRNLVLRGVDGVIIALSNDLDTEDVDFLESYDIPFVVVQNNLADSRVVSVNVDNTEAIAAATRHLLSLGHQRIFHAVGPLESGIYRDRMEGYVQAMQDAGLAVVGEMLVPSGGFMFHDGYWCMKRLLAREVRPTAVLFANDITAFGAYQAAKEEGVSIPRDISIVGFDYLAGFMDVAGLLPDLTTMVQPTGEIGATAAKLLLEQITQGTRADSVMIHPTLHVGGTTAPPRQSGQGE